jgi:hypothetical protein
VTVNGAIKIRRTVYAVSGGGTVVPLDEWLGIVAGAVSVGARELACRATMAGVSFKKAAANLERLAQIRMGHEQLREVTEAEGRAVLKATEAGVVGPDWTAADCALAPGGPTRLMLGADGVKVPVVTAAEKQKRRANRKARRKARRGKRRGRTRRQRRHPGADQAWKEFKIAVFYNASGEHQYAIGTAGNHNVLGRRMRREAGKLAIGEAQQKVAVTDGAEWIQHQLRTRLPMVNVRILDYFHLMEHVGEAVAACFGEGTEAAKTWREAMAKAVNEEGGVGLLVKIHETQRTVRSPAKREALRKLEQYVAKRVEMLDYPSFRAQGFDIGSGPTEAFCKTLTARLKGSGMRWDRPNAEALMALAALEHSHLWDGYWALQRKAAA